jgi:hypothetical protein
VVGELAPVGDAELAQQRRHVGLHGPDRDEHPVGDLGVGKVLPDRGQHLGLPLRDVDPPHTTHPDIMADLAKLSGMVDKLGPVTADDVTVVVAAAVAALAPTADRDWTAPAGDLTWNCWETVEHVADDLFCYAAQLGVDGVPRYLPVRAEANYPGGEPNSIRVDPEEGLDGLLMVLTSMGALLASMVRTAPATARAHHSFGFADGEASAAMGVLETLVHVRDVATAFDVAWDPDPDVCARVLARLLPEVERTEDAWADLLWATGRIELPGRPRRTSWRWDNAPRRGE